MCNCQRKYLHHFEQLAPFCRTTTKTTRMCKFTKRYHLSASAFRSASRSAVAAETTRAYSLGASSAAYTRCSQASECRCTDERNSAADKHSKKCPIIVVVYNRKLGQKAEKFTFSLVETNIAHCLGAAWYSNCFV